MVSRQFLSRFLGLLITAILISGCGNSKSPEALLFETITAIQTAAESRDTQDLMSHVREDYQDSGGRDWRDVRAIAQFQFIRHQKIYAFKHITHLKVDDDQRNARATILVAIAGEPIDNADQLQQLRADLMRFDLDFIFDEQWQIRSASWERARISDFLL